MRSAQGTTWCWCSWRPWGSIHRSPSKCSDLHLQLEGYPVEQGVEIEIPLLPPGGRGAAKGFG
jgi:hypothetical protein